MQRDSSTYCDEPEDGEDYGAWLAAFDLAAKKPDIDRLIAENTFMSELQVGGWGGKVCTCGYMDVFIQAGCGAGEHLHVGAAGGYMGVAVIAGQVEPVGAGRVPLRQHLHVRAAGR